MKFKLPFWTCRDLVSPASIPMLALLLLAPAGASAQGALPELRAVTASRIALGTGDTIAVTATGEGDPVVLVPGLLGSAFSFRHLAELLADEGLRTIVVEPLGTGASAKPRKADYTLEAQALRVAATLDSLGIGRADFVCHSVGASICMRLALHAPERVRSIVSLNGGPDERAATGGLKGALRLAPFLKLFGGERIARNKVRNGLRASAADPAWVTEEVVRGYTAPYSDLTAVLRALNAMSESKEPVALGPRLAELETPVLLLIGTGGEQPGTSPEDLAAMTGSMPALTVDSIAGAGQYPQEEQPEVVAAAVLEFLRGLPALEARSLPARAP
jgi:pimeloyl-ACP methyl ester carboxylesterase